MTAKDISTMHQDFFLEVCHALMKRGRKEVFNASRSPMLNLIDMVFLKHSKRVHDWFLREIQSTNELHLVRVLVWAIDLIKNSELIDQPTDTLLTKHGLRWLEFALKYFAHQHITVVRKAMELTQRFTTVIARDLAYRDYLFDISLQTIKYFTLVRDALTERDLEHLLDLESTTFVHQRLPDTDWVVDRECLSLIIQLGVRCLDGLFLAGGEINLNIVRQVQQLLRPLKDVPLATCLDYFYDIVGSNDGALISVQLNMLVLSFAFDQNPMTGPVLPVIKDFVSRFNSYVLFFHFLVKTGMSYELVVDLLMSDSDTFLELFIGIMKFVESDPKRLMRAIEDVTDAYNENVDYDGGRDSDDVVEYTVDDVLDLFNNVARIIQTRGFPYDTTPLVKIMKPALAALNRARSQAKSNTK
ncbi:hypothetical protein BC940DRAFT_319260 [Gongronella butleri]|nr:hypothetical protein BC940DRAFT_319260 [Gongronella butleri]